MTSPIVRRSATVIAIAALALLGLRPTRSVSVHPADAVLVTPGASETVVRRLADSLGAQRIIRLAGRDSLPDAGYVARHFGDARRLHVVGWGLDASDWRALGTAPASVHPSPPPPGFTAASWPERIVLGEDVRVTGSLGGRVGARVYLSDASGALDSSATLADGSFALRTRPAAAGRLRLVLRAAGLEAETLGVVVSPAPRRRTLILTAAPSFEAAALRDLLAQSGAPVAWRSGISRAHARTELLNRASAAIEAQDLIVADGRAYAALSGAERAALLRVVADSGAGLILLADDQGAAARQLGFSLAADTALSERLVRPRAADGRPAVSPVPAEPYRLRDAFGAGPVLWGTSGEVLAQVMPRGAGRIVLTLVIAPSRWLRAGERAQFAAYWSALVAAAAGSRDTDWQVTGGRVQQPLEIGLRSTRAPSPAVVVAPDGSRDTVYLTRDPIDAGRWVGRYWPRESGWHEIVGAGDNGAFFVANTQAWRAREATMRLAATARWAATAPVAGPERPPERARRPIPLGWWLGVFVIAAAVLWADRRRAYIRAMPRTAVVAAAAAVLLLALAACGKSEEHKRAEVDRCAAVNTSADLISLCLISEHKWKDHAADSAAAKKAHELDSTRTSQENALWNADAARHRAAVQECGKTNDMHECLLVRFGWSQERATFTSDSAWQKNAAMHAREVRSCQRGRNPVASCLMLNYKWNAARAMALEDSLRRAALRR